MDNQLNTSDPIALSLLLTDDLYVIDKPNESVATENQIVAKNEIIQAEPVNLVPALPIVKQEVPIKPNTKPFYNYLGDNNKSFLIIILNKEIDYLASADLEFLLKIIKVKGMVLEDIAVLNMAKYQNLTFDNLKDFFACNKMLTFGIDPKVLGVVGITANHVFNFKNTSVLGTWDLNQLNTDVKKKTTFWNQFKTF